jgi:hypothetical protein
MAKKNLKKIEILLTPAGMYSLSANVGDKIEIEKKQADEMIASSHAKAIK